MPEQWQMCVVLKKSRILEIYSPGVKRTHPYEKFLRRRDIKLGPIPTDTVICTLLSEGWEPRSTNFEDRFFFRKKIQEK